MRPTSETTTEECSGAEFPAPEQDLRAFHRDVLVLVAELSYTGPSLPLKVELATRRRALSAFWSRWLACSWVGHPSNEKLSELEFHLREKNWLARFATVEAAVRHLQKAVRGRSKPCEDLPLLPELVAAPVDDFEQMQVEAELEEALQILDGPCRAYLAARLAGETWDQAAADLGADQATMRRHRDKARKSFQELRSYSPPNPKRVRARLKRR